MFELIISVAVFVLEIILLLEIIFVVGAWARGHGVFLLKARAPTRSRTSQNSGASIAGATVPLLRYAPLT